LRCTLAHGLQFLSGGGHGGLDGGDLATPALVPDLLEAVDDVGVDLLETWHVGRVQRVAGADDRDAMTGDPQYGRLTAGRR
jgi:hypothetical protein